MARGPMKRYVRPLAQPDMLKMLLPRTPSLLKGRARRQSTWHMRPSGSLVQCHASTEPAQYESPLYLRKTLEAVCPVELFKVAGVTFEGRQARARCGEGAKQTPTPDPHHCLFIGLPLGLPKVITCYRTWRQDRLSLFSPPSRFFLPDPPPMVPPPLPPQPSAMVLPVIPAPVECCALQDVVKSLFAHQAVMLLRQPWNVSCGSAGRCGG